MNLINVLRSKISGQVYEKDKTWQYNYSRNKKIIPRYVVLPEGINDVLACYEIAIKNKLTVAYRGAGHSFNQQSLISDLLIVTPKKDPDLKRLENNVYEINASAYWTNVETNLNIINLSVPVLTDYLDLSVAGTLSVGAYGIRSIKYGKQIEHIKAVRITTADGTTQWCSEKENIDLYRFTLCGLGMLGYIDKAIINTTEYIPSVQLLTFEHKNFSDLFQSLFILKNNVNKKLLQYDATYFKDGNRITSRYGFKLSDYQFFKDQIANEFNAKKDMMLLVENSIYTDYTMLNHQHVKEWSQNFGNKEKIWIDYIVGYSALERLIYFLENFIASNSHAKYLECVYIVAIKKNSTKMEVPFLASSSTQENVEFLLGIYFFIPNNNIKIKETVLTLMDETLNICIAEKGRPYLQGSHVLSKSSLEKLYGNSITELKKIKNHYDPHGIIKMYECFRSIE